MLGLDTPHGPAASGSRSRSSSSPTGSRAAGRPRPPHLLDRAWIPVVEQLRAGPLVGLPVVTGGRSSGARVACRTAEAVGAVGVLCLAFPLVAPSGKSRQEELDGVSVPVLVVQGDLDQRRGSLLVRRGKGGRRREVGMDAWGWEQLQPWLELRCALPVGPLLCVINGATCGRQWTCAAAQADLRRTAAAAGVRRRFAPHQLRHAHAVEMAREGVR